MEMKYVINWKIRKIEKYLLMQIYEGKFSVLCNDRL